MYAFPDGHKLLRSEAISHFLVFPELTILIWYNIGIHKYVEYLSDSMFWGSPSSYHKCHLYFTLILCHLNVLHLILYSAALSPPWEHICWPLQLFFFHISELDQLWWHLFIALVLGEKQMKLFFSPLNLCVCP